MKEKISQINQESIKELVYSFYGRVRKDKDLSPIFEQVIGKTDEQWKDHLVTMCNFWSDRMLETDLFRGNPMKKHRDLPSFDMSLFDRWLDLFADTASEIHSEDIAMQYILKSKAIAKNLKYAIMSK